MTEQMTDPFTEAVQDEFDELGELSPDDGADVALIDRVLRMISRRQDEILRIKAYADREMPRLKREIESITGWMGPRVEDAVSRLVHGGKIKSVRRPWGVAGFRNRSKPVLVADPNDADALADWCKTNLPDGVHLGTPAASLQKEVIASYIQGGGECPLATIKQPGVDFYMRTSKPKKDAENE